MVRLVERVHAPPQLLLESLADHDAEPFLLDALIDHGEELTRPSRVFLFGRRTDHGHDRAVRPRTERDEGWPLPCLQIVVELHVVVGVDEGLPDLQVLDGVEELPTLLRIKLVDEHVFLIAHFASKCLLVRHEPKQHFAHMPRKSSISFLERREAQVLDVREINVAHDVGEGMFDVIAVPFAPSFRHKVGIGHYGMSLEKKNAAGCAGVRIIAQNNEVSKKCAALYTSRSISPCELRESVSYCRQLDGSLAPKGSWPPKCSIDEVNHQFFSHMATNKLYVGGIPYRTTEDELRTAFEEAGTVSSVSIISDRMTGRSRGFGFVEMADEAQAQAAIDRWDGKEMDGRMLSVSFARPQSDRPAGGDRGGRGGFGGGRGGFGGGDRGGFGGGY